MSVEAIEVHPGATSVLRKFFAAACLLSALSFCWYTVADAVGGFGIILAAPTGGTVRGSVALEAHTTADASDVDFVLRSESGEYNAVIDGVRGDSVGSIWVGAWLTDGLPSGNYLVSAIASSTTGVRVESILTLVQLDRSVVTPPTVVVEQISIVSPAVDSLVSGTITLEARANAAVDAVVFVVSGDQLSASIPVESSPTASGSWSAVWDSRAVINGEVSVQAKAVRGDTVIDSAAVGFMIDNPALIVSLTSPINGSTHMDSVFFAAQTSLPVSSLSFEIRDSSGRVVATDLRAQQSGNSDWTSWTFAWDAARAALGDYTVTASAKGGMSDPTVFVLGEPTVGAVPEVPSENPDAIEEADESGAVTVALNAPADNTVLSGNVELIASTTDDATQVGFEIRSIVNSDDVIVLTGERLSDANRWQGRWNTDDIADGTYFVQAIATAGTIRAVSRRIAMTIKNQTATDNLTVRISSPTSGDKVSGEVNLQIGTAEGVESVKLTVSPLDSISMDYLRELVASTSEADRTSWTAKWDAGIFPVGEYQIIATATKENFRESSSPIVVEIENSAASILSESYEISLVKPIADTDVRGEIELAAKVEGRISTAQFVVASGGGSETNALTSIEAKETSTGQWIGHWNSLNLDDGEYRIRLQVSLFDKSVVYSDWVAFRISNAANEDIKLRIVSPVTGARLNGLIGITVDVAGAVDDVSIVIEGDTATDYSLKLAASSVGQDRWQTIWGTANVQSGEYSMTAVAKIGDVGIVSEQILVRVTADGELAGTESDEENVIGDKVSESSALNVLNPASGTVQGIVMLLAEISGNIQDVRFVVRLHNDGRTVLSRTAALDRTRNLWASYWNSSLFESGEYDLYATGIDSTGQRLQSKSLLVSVGTNESDETENYWLSRTIVEIPSEAVRQSVLELPLGTRTTTVTDAPIDTSLAEGELRKECDAAGIKPERCQLWLASRYSSFECRQAGIITKQECLAYLAKLQGGKIAACSGYDTTGCKNYVAKMTGGLLDDQEADDFSRQLLPAIGTVARLTSRSGEVATFDQITALIAERAPIGGNADIAVRVYASPAFVQVDEQTSRRAIPAVIFVDSDSDGLPDDVERRLGTDADLSDTDSDGYSDTEEIRNGYNPLGSGRLGELGSASMMSLAPIDIALLSGAPLHQPTTSGQTNATYTINLGNRLSSETGVDSSPKLTLAGQAEPNSVVTLFIYSYLPMVLTAVTDEAGNWNYEFEQNLVDGRHEVYVAVTDDTGRISEKSQPFAFFVSSAEAVTEDNFFGVAEANDESSHPAVEDINQRGFSWYIAGVAVLAAMTLILGAVFIIRSRKNSGIDQF
ncbi:MAG: Ig-like domain-containing protein [Patescibacteria group bacterium]